MSQKEAKDIPISNNYIQTPDDFKKASFKLPNSARILNYIEIVYQNIDGSISRKKVDIDKLFNWKKRLYLSYNFHSKPPIRTYNSATISSNGVITKRIVTKTVKKRVSKIVNNRVVYDKTEVINSKKPIRDDVKDEIAVTHYMNKDLERRERELKEAEKALSSVNPESSSFRTTSSDNKDKMVVNSTGSIYSGSSVWEGTNSGKGENVKDSRVTISLGKPRFSQFEFNIIEHKIKISTTDKKSRHFMLIRPNRIVVDFIRDVSFPNQTFEINKGVFGEMKVAKKGSSSYRVTIFLKEGYRYKLTRTEIGYNVKCFKR